MGNETSLKTSQGGGGGGGVAIPSTLLLDSPLQPLHLLVEARFIWNQRKC